MNNKADYEAVTDLNVMKASKDEVSDVKGCINILNDKLKHLSIIQSEILSNISSFKEHQKGKKIV